MKNISFLLLLAVVLMHCKSKDTKPQYPLNLIEGEWKPIKILEHESSEWKDIQNDMFPSNITFRYDGLLLNSNGEANCCLNQQYIINGEQVILDYKEKVPFIKGCELMFCFACPFLVMQIEKDTLTIRFCNENGYDLKLSKVNL